MVNRRDVLIGSTSAALAGLVAGGVKAQAQATAPYPGLPSYYPADYGSIIEGSKAEKSLLFYASISSSQIQPLLNGYKKLYPWMAVQYLESSADGTIERYLNETGTGSPTASILFSAAPLSWLRVIQKGGVINYASPEKPYLLRQESFDPGLYVGGNDPLVIIWNKAIVPANLAPTGFGDLAAKVKAHPEVFNGKLTTYPLDQNGYAYAANWALAQYQGDKIWDSYKIVGPQTKFETSNGIMLEKVISGEYVVGYILAGGTSFVTLASDAAAAKVLGVTYIADGDPVSIRSIGTVKGGSTPNAAKLMLDYILSKEGQKLYGAIGRPPARTDVASADIGGGETLDSIVKKVGKQNLVYADADPKMASDYDGFVKRWKTANGVL